MNFTRTSFFLIFVLSISTTSYGQYFANPSLEGYRDWSSTPRNWNTCNEYSTPDTQPSFWNIRLQPSDGQSYLSLMVRGRYTEPFFQVRNNTNEDIQTALQTPFYRDGCYQLALDLANSKTADDGYEYLGRPALLKIWGGSSSCDKKELLWTSPTIDHQTWKRYEFNFSANSDIRWLILEAYYTQLPEYFGNILIDNLSAKNLTQEVDLGEDINTCFYDIPVTLSTQTSNSNNSYLWSTGETTPEIEVTQSDTYFVTASAFGCEFSDSINVKIIEQIDVDIDLGEDVVLCPGYILDFGIEKNENSTIKWNTGSDSTSIQITESGNYSVELISKCEILTDDINVSYKESCCQLDLPNTFSPNNDFVNDYFAIEGEKDMIREYALKIHNRLGELIFESQSFENEWDGKINGAVAATGTYFWEITYNCQIGDALTPNYLKGVINVKR